MLILTCFSVLVTPSFAVNVTDLYTLDGRSTINSYVETGRTTGPNFVYINGKLLCNFGSLGVDTGGQDKTYMKEYSGSWGEKWEVLAGMAHNGWEFPMVALGSNIIGVALDNARPYGSNCRPLLIYSSNPSYGHSWTSGGYLSGIGSYCYPYQGIVTDDGAIIFTGWSSSGSVIFTWCCSSNANPLAASSYSRGSNVPTAGDEPSVVELAPKGTGHLLMAFRATGGSVGWCESSNYGATWTNVHYGLSSPAAPQALLRLSWVPDRIMVAWDNNPISGQRTPLCLAISEDGGGSWGTPYEVASKTSEGGYPCYPRLVLCGGVNVGLGYWVTDVTGQGGTGSGELTRFAMFVPVGSGNFDVTIQAYCDKEGRSLTDLSVTGLNGVHWNQEPFTYTVTTGSYTFTVPATDTNGDAFRRWSTGDTSVSLTVHSANTYTAYYGVQTTPELPYLEIAFGIGAIILVGALALTRYGVGSGHRRKRRR